MNPEALFWLVIAAIALLMSILSATAADLPNVPGALNPVVTQANIKRTVCVSGWTKTVRPRVSVTNRIKRKLLAPGERAQDFELDHLVSLQLGGAPADERNLWLEPYAGNCGARVKDVLETNLKRRVCKGTLTLEQAQAAIVANWVNAYNLYVGHLECGQQVIVEDRKAPPLTCLLGPMCRNKCVR